MNKKIILSADSTCDLGTELKDNYGVNYYPFHIILGDKDYQDNVDITPDEIFKVYQEKKILPKTAAINVQEYADYFSPWTEQGHEVIHLNLGSGLSSAHQNCMLAAGMTEGVYPIDSYNLSTGIGLLVLDAADMIAEGKLTAREIAAEIKRRRGLVHASFILDTLQFMSAGGRCSTVTAIGAGILNIKPCIEVDNTSGCMHVGRKYRGKLSNVLVKYTKDKLAEYQHINTKRIFITHSGIDPSYIDLVKETIESVVKFQHIYVTRASCTISSHCGPNTLGILFETEE